MCSFVIVGINMQHQIQTLHLKLTVEMGKYDWSMGLISSKEEWRYASIVPGALCVIMGLVRMKQRLYADNCFNMHMMAPLHSVELLLVKGMALYLWTILDVVEMKES